MSSLTEGQLIDDASGWRGGRNWTWGNGAMKAAGRIALSAPPALRPGGCAAIPDAGRAAPRRPVECGDLPFRILRDGTWLYRNSPIGRKELVCLFASVLRREADGSFWLQTPAERGRIEVDDAPFVAVELDWHGVGRNQCLTFRTNVDKLVCAGREHPIRVAHDLLTCEPTPYLHLTAGSGRFPLEARICRAVYYELVALAEPHEVLGRNMLGVWSEGCFFPLGEMPAADEPDET